MAQQGQTKRLELVHGKDKEIKLPFHVWTAGQREFTPLLLGLYELLPGGGQSKDADIDWVVIEEPEMGLHPQAIDAFLVLVLDLLSRGYRVVLSTHSPHVLAAVWMLRYLKEYGADEAILRQVFKLASGSKMKAMAKAVLQKSIKVHVLSIENEKVHAKDISTLDAGAEDEEIAGWGGLSGLTSRFSDAVANAANAAGRD